MAVLLPLSPLVAQGGLRVVESSAVAEFPQGMVFHLTASSDVDITDIRLCYSVRRQSLAEVTSEVYINFVPQREVNVSWALEMVRFGGLPSGSLVDYWWLAC